MCAHDAAATHPSASPNVVMSARLHVMFLKIFGMVDPEAFVKLFEYVAAA